MISLLRRDYRVSLAIISDQSEQRAWDRDRKIRSIEQRFKRAQHREVISTRRTRGKRFTRGYIEFDEARGKGTPGRAGRPIATRGGSSVTLIIESASP